MSRNYGVGSGPTWDVVRGRELWVIGRHAEEIADELGVTQNAINCAAIRYKWPVRRIRATKASSVVPLRRCPECLGSYVDNHECSRRNGMLAVTIGWAAA